MSVDKYLLKSYLFIFLKTQKVGLLGGRGIRVKKHKPRNSLERSVWFPRWRRVLFCSRLLKSWKNLVPSSGALHPLGGANATLRAGGGRRRLQKAAEAASELLWWQLNILPPWSNGEPLMSVSIFITMDSCGRVSGSYWLCAGAQVMALLCIVKVRKRSRNTEMGKEALRVWLKCHF